MEQELDTGESRWKMAGTLILIGYLTLAVIFGVWQPWWALVGSVVVALAVSPIAFYVTEGDRTRKVREFRAVLMILTLAWLVIMLLTLWIARQVDVNPAPAPRPVVQSWEA